ncbi:LysR family transcriptional regulator [bacterium C-53]|nr:LysR family transcriptional regulator [Lachnospiraceae bacterium]NBI03254.1 LysR family transcriptional regulator [Lachnospiraceae bacterium]RKJ10157.1 LysR family transcriptional regulator [bacterium C-53]
METRLLQYFLAVAEEQSITKAAEYLHISQPTLSKQMMDLEENLGRQLLVRGRKKVTLTEDGTFLRGRAQEIISLMDKTESAFRENEQSIAGDVYIGCGEYRSTFSIMQIIRSIQEEYPDIRFHIFSSNADAIIERLDKGLLDMGFLLAPEIIPRYDYQKLPLHEAWGILMRKDSPLANQTDISLPELAGLPLIMPSQTSNSGHLSTSFAEAMTKPNIVCTYNLIYNAGLMVEAGIGYALCIDDLINTAGSHPLTFRPLFPKLYSDVYLFTKKYQVFSKAAKLFLNRLEKNICNL